MKKNLILFAILITMWGVLPAQNKIVLQASTAKDTINRNIYGHFAEHLGKCIYGGFYVGEGNKNIPGSRESHRFSVINFII